MNLKETNINKGVAVILLLLYHMVSFYGWTEQYPLKELFIPFTIWQKLAVGGQICVSIFLFLTIYGITKQYKLRNITNAKEVTAYTVRRYLSLMLGFWLIFILSIIIFSKKQNINTLYGENVFKNMLIDFMGFSTKFATPSFNSTWWFIGMAISTIIFSPFLIILAKKLGFISVPFSYLFSFWFAGPFADYFVVLMCAACFAEYDLFEKINIDFQKNKLVKLVFNIFYITLIIAMLYLRDSIIIDRNITNPIICITIIIYVKLFLCEGLYLGKALELLGKNSMNIFLIHTFFYYYFYSSIIYSCQYILLCLVTLIFISLAVSVVLEYLKRKLGFYQLQNYLWDKVDSAILFLH